MRTWMKLYSPWVDTSQLYVYEPPPIPTPALPLSSRIEGQRRGKKGGSWSGGRVHVMPNGGFLCLPCTSQYLLIGSLKSLVFGPPYFLHGKSCV